jgi:hypothetical protein
MAYAIACATDSAIGLRAIGQSPFAEALLLFFAFSFAR